jgi:hypothetical protein
MSTEIIGLLIVLAILALGTLYAFKGSAISEQWWSWISRACLAAGLVFAIGMLILAGRRRFKQTSTRQCMAAGNRHHAGRGFDHSSF